LDAYNEWTVERNDKLMEWDQYFIEMATLVSKKSKDRSTKVGCVIVGPNHEVRTTGYNGFCRGINDDIDERHDRPEKYFWVEHAERNAIYNAARNGIPLEGCTAYVSNLLPCADCTRGMIQSGIKRIMFCSGEANEKWSESFQRSLIMAREAKVEMLVL
jgi:dCMP deaminase